MPALKHLVTDYSKALNGLKDSLIQQHSIFPPAFPFGAHIHYQWHLAVLGFGMLAFFQWWLYVCSPACRLHSYLRQFCCSFVSEWKPKRYTSTTGKHRMSPYKQEWLTSSIISRQLLGLNITDPTHWSRWKKVTSFKSMHCSKFCTSTWLLAQQ